MPQDPALQHDAPFRGVENTYFPARGGCRVTLYKDAHVGHVPEIPLAGGRLYQPACCWIDMYNAICSAKHFIYVTGALLKRSSVSLEEPHPEQIITLMSKCPFKVYGFGPET